MSKDLGGFGEHNVLDHILNFGRQLPKLGFGEIDYRSCMACNDSRAEGSFCEIIDVKWG